jgi:hypothetical protein
VLGPAIVGGIGRGRCPVCGPFPAEPLKLGERRGRHEMLFDAPSPGNVLSGNAQHLAFCPGTVVRQPEMHDPVLDDTSPVRSLAHLRSVSPEQPILTAIEPIASHCEVGSPACSSTIRPARSRTSGAYRTDDLCSSIAPSPQGSEPPANPARFRIVFLTPLETASRAAENWMFGVLEVLCRARRCDGRGWLLLPVLSGRAPQPVSRCFPASAQRPGKHKTAPKDRSKLLVFLIKFGAGEGIRTPDPNLGKVVLYP